jgi:hypothetical protein
MLALSVFSCGAVAVTSTVSAVLPMLREKLYREG